MFNKSKMFTAQKMGLTDKGPTGQEWVFSKNNLMSYTGDGTLNTITSAGVTPNRIPEQKRGREILYQRDNEARYIDHDRGYDVREVRNHGYVTKRIMDLRTGKTWIEDHQDYSRVELTPLPGSYTMADTFTIPYGYGGGGGGAMTATEVLQRQKFYGY